MNENQLKTKIILLRGFDTSMVIALTAVAIYSALYSEEKEFMIIACMVGLLLVSILGRAIANKVAVLRVQLEMVQREKRTEEQRTLMGTRHTTTRAAKTTVINTNPTTKK